VNLDSKASCLMGGRRGLHRDGADGNATLGSWPARFAGALFNLDLRGFPRDPRAPTRLASGLRAHVLRRRTVARSSAAATSGSQIAGLPELSCPVPWHPAVRGPVLFRHDVLVWAPPLRPVATAVVVGCSSGRAGVSPCGRRRREPDSRLCRRPGSASASSTRRLFLAGLLGEIRPRAHLSPGSRQDVAEWMIGGPWIPSRSPS